MVAPEPTPYPPPGPPRCYAHPDRVAGSVCRRCNRPICPDCMREAPVGWQCASCVRKGAKVSPTVRWRPRAPGRLGNTRVTPVVIGLIVVCVIVYILQVTNNQVELYSHFGVNIACNKADCNYALYPLAVHHGQWYRLITAAFMHASFEHIFFNMATLAIIGPAVEAEIGGPRFLYLYLLAAVGGSVASYLLDPAVELGLGASGAIFGVMGAYFVLARVRKWDTTTIIALVVVNLVIDILPSSGIDWRAHIGGLIVGVGVTAAMVYGPSALGRRAGQNGPGLIFESSVVVVTLVVLAALVLLPPGHVNLS